MNLKSWLRLTNKKETNMNPWILIIAQYGLPAALEIKELFESKLEPTVEDFRELVTKYGTETMEQKLAQAKELIAAAKPPGV